MRCPPCFRLCQSLPRLPYASLANRRLCQSLPIFSNGNLCHIYANLCQSSHMPIFAYTFFRKCRLSHMQMFGLPTLISTLTTPIFCVPIWISTFTNAALHRASSPLFHAAIEGFANIRTSSLLHVLVYPCQCRSSPRHTILAQRTLAGCVCVCVCVCACVCMRVFEEWVRAYAWM